MNSLIRETNERLLSHWVDEGYFRGMQQLVDWVSRPFSAAVKGVADNRVTDVGQVHPDLVGPSRQQPAAKMGILPAAGQNFKFSTGPPAGLPDFHSFPVDIPSGDGGIDKSYHNTCRLPRFGKDLQAGGGCGCHVLPARSLMYPYQAGERYRAGRSPQGLTAHRETVPAGH